MKVLAILIWVVAVLATTGRAYDITTRDGTVYEDIRLQEKTDVGIRIKHTSGVVFLDYSRIPVPDLWTFGYDETKYKVAKGTGGGTRPGTSTAARPATPAARPSTGGARPSGVQRLYEPTRPAATPAPATSDYSPPRSSGTSSSSGSSQCGGLTQKGYRCKRMVKGGGNCYQH